MKTIESAALKYAEPIATYTYFKGMDDLTYCDLEDCIAESFKAGVEFAQQMTSFDKEKPEYYTPVIVEYGKLQVIAWLAWSETNGYIWTINGTDVCIRHKPNIKWRHINIK